MRRRRAVNRTGGATLLVLAAVAVVAFAAIGALAAASEMRRQEVAERAILDAELATEGALARRLVSWSAREAARASAAWLDDGVAPTDHAVSTSLQRAGPGLWRLDAVADRLTPDGELLARRSRTLFLRARPPTIPLDAPLTAAGELRLGGGVRVDASGLQPPGWSCAAASPAVAPLALLSGASVSGAVPAPVLDADPGIVAELLAGLGLSVGVAERVLEPTLRHPTLLGPSLDATGAGPPGLCPLGAPDESAPPLLWGDPARPSPCERYFPYVHVEGDLVAPSGAGQGVLVVDGDLTLMGSFTWAGLIVVRGALRTAGTGTRIHGAVALLGTGPHELDGDVDIAWSPCAVREAVLASARVTPVTGSAWSALR